MQCFGSVFLELQAVFLIQCQLPLQITQLDLCCTQTPHHDLPQSWSSHTPTEGSGVVFYCCHNYSKHPLRCDEYAVFALPALTITAQIIKQTEG